MLKRADQLTLSNEVRLALKCSQQPLWFILISDMSISHASDVSHERGRVQDHEQHKRHLCYRFYDLQNL